YTTLFRSFIVKGKRHGKDFERVNTFDRAGYEWNNEEWKPLESSLAESILGLSYDNFRRTIIIPQGKFQEFLQLGHSNRTQMLKEIFQLEKRSEEHTSELQSRENLVCRLLLEKKNTLIIQVC